MENRSFSDVGGTPGGLGYFLIGCALAPLDNFTGFVAEPFYPKQEPTKHAVRAPQSHFVLAPIISVVERSPFFHQSREVLAMNRCPPSPAVRFLRRQTRVLIPLLIYEIDGTIRMTGPGKHRHIVN